MKNLSLIALGILALGLTFTSCDKVTSNQLNNDMTSAGDYASLLGLMDLTETEDATPGDELKSADVSDFLPCFEVIIHTNEDGEFWPRSWTFSYTNEDCVDRFGNTRLGSVHLKLTDFWKNEGSLRTINYEDFTINGDKIEGARTIQNTGLNEKMNLTFERTCEDASYSRADTATMSWTSNRSVEMIAGYETFVGVDDEYMVSGGANGINFDGLSFTVSVTDDLYYKKCSLFPVSGSITIEIEGESTIYINYGDGECDNVAEMTVDNVSSEITLGIGRQGCRAQS